MSAAVARFVLRRRWPLALVWLAVSALLGHAALTRLSVRAGIEQMVDEGSAADRAAAGELGGLSELAVLVEGAVWSARFLARLGKLEAELAELRLPDNGQGRRALFDGSLSVLSASRLESRGEALLGGPLSNVLQEQGVAAFRAAAEQQPAVRGRLVDAGGGLALLSLRGPRLDDDEVVAATRAVRSVAERHDRAGFRVSVAGLPVLKSTVATMLYDDIGRLFGLSVGVAMLVLIATFRDLLGVIGPALVIGCTSAWTFGSMALSGVPLTIVGLYLPAFLTVVAIGDAIHLQSIYRAERLSGRARDAAIVRACSAAGPPIFYTSVTTCAGLLGLHAAQIEAIRDLGTFGALGIASAWAHTLVLVPIALSLGSDRALARPAAARFGWPDRVLATIATLSAPERGGPRRWLALALVLALISAAGISRLRVYHEPLEWLPEGNALAPAVARMDARLGGSALMTLSLEWSEPGALRDPDTLQRLAEVERQLLRYRDPEQGALVASVSSVLDVVRGTWRALREGGSGPAAPLPRSRGETDGVYQFLELLGTAELDRFVNARRDATRMEVRMAWADAGTYGGVIEAAERAAREQLGPAVDARVVGPVADMNRAVNALLGDLLRSFAVSCTGVALALIAFMGSLRLGLIAMVPNLLPIAIVLGAMGFWGFPLDVHTVLLSTVLLGVVVDDTIHFLHHFRAGFARSGDVEQSLGDSFRQAGRALLVTSLTLGLGFLTCLASSMHHMQRMAVLLAFAIAVALAIDLVLTPAFIRRFVR